MNNTTEETEESFVLNYRYYCDYFAEQIFSTIQDSRTVSLYISPSHSRYSSLLDF